VRPETKELTLPEIDALVAERIMGWKAIGSGAYHVPTGGAGGAGDRTDRFHPTRWWDDAGCVIDRMRELGWLLTMIEYPIEVDVEFRRFDGTNVVEARSPSRLIALVLCCLAAVTGERYSVKEE
jgi:hypothetical protein